MTKLTGLIGYPVSHSLSPKIHEHWIAEHKLDAEYKLFTTPPARVRQVIDRMRKKNAAGVNVTVPHKLAVMEYLDRIDDVAQRIGAVNTIINHEGIFIGSNTDAYGFITNLKQGLGDLTPYLNHVVILGAGGATRAALVALIDAGAKKITIANRTEDKAQALAQEFAAQNAAAKIEATTWENREKIAEDASLLVNTTSLGMLQHEPLHFNINALPKTAAVHDIVYAPLETQLLKDARAHGNATVDGLGMLLFQAQQAFKLWHGILPEVTNELRTKILEQRV